MTDRTEGSQYKVSQRLSDADSLEEAVSANRVGARA
jgi:hypothetical protein